MSSDGFVTRTRGTYAFLSPECVEQQPDRQGHDGRAADVWAVGMTTWALLFHFVPSLGLTRPDTSSLGEGTDECCDVVGPWGEYGGLEGLFNTLAKADYKIPSGEEGESISDGARMFLTDILNRDYNSRLRTAETALDHPWLQGANMKSMELYLSEARKAGLGEIPPRVDNCEHLEQQFDDAIEQCE
eukprot:GHVS01020504.1.p1 GENE.GHVS01020504.1~~GHVS01020504.1.p1  ORF type:complete len:187 (-),score=24.60 GHVS01020504.1:137-697(-)